MYHLLTVGFTKDAIENVTEGTSRSDPFTFHIIAAFLADYKSIVSSSDFLDKFNDTVIDVPAEDMYYLLQTFASMAMARPWSDCDFIYCVTTDLFKVYSTDSGFVSH